MTDDEIQLAREYQRNVRKKQPTTPEQKRAWSLRVQAYAAKSPAKRKPGVGGQARWRRAHRARRLLLDAIKVHAGCVDCRGKFPPECLDFDHVSGGKRFSIGANLRRSVAAVLDEIAKCEVVCANCHRIRTSARQRAAGLLETPAARPTLDHAGNRIDFWQLAVERGLLPQQQE